MARSGSGRRAWVSGEIVRKDVVVSLQRSAGSAGDPPCLHEVIQPLAERNDGAHDARSPRSGSTTKLGRARPAGQMSCRPSSTAIIGIVRTTRAGASLPCRASSAQTTRWHTAASSIVPLRTEKACPLYASPPRRCFAIIVPVARNRQNDEQTAHAARLRESRSRNHELGVWMVCEPRAKR